MTTLPAQQSYLSVGVGFACCFPEGFLVYRRRSLTHFLIVTGGSMSEVLHSQTGY